MEYFVEFHDELILIRRRIDTGDEIADSIKEVPPGGSFYHLSYEELRSQGEGSFELDPATVSIPQPNWANNDDSEGEEV